VAENLPCTQENCCFSPRGHCFLVTSAYIQSHRGCSKDQDGTGSGGPYWNQSEFEDFLKRTIQQAERQKCPQLDLINQLLSSILHLKDEKKEFVGV
jgi:hypothetical protein